MNSTRTTPSTRLLAALAALPLLGVSAAHAQFVLTGTGYSQNFDSIGSGLPTNWDVRTGANATSLGTTATPILTPATGTDWGNTGGGFKNFASATGLTSSADSATQQAATDRALGIRQTGAIGDPGAAFYFNFNSTGKTFSALSIDLEMLSVQARSTIWTLQYGIGATPTSFTTLGTTFTDPGLFGTTTVSFGSGDLVGLNNQSSVWFRVVALSASTGSGSRDSFGIDNFSLTFSAAGAEISIGPGLLFSSGSFGGATFDASDTAVFDGAAGTVELSGTVEAAGLKFVSNGYTLASPTDSDTIAVAGSVEVADGAAATLAGKVTGANALTKTGNGTLVLTNTTNDFVGNVSVNAGVLQVGSDAVLGNADNNVRLGGGVFQPTQSLALGAGRDITGSGTVLIGAGQTLTVNGALAAGALTLSGPGTLALGGTGNTVAGLTLSAPAAITGNAITLEGNVTTGAYAFTATVGNDLALGGTSRTFNLDGNLSLNGALSTSAAGAYVVKNGPGTLTINGSTAGHQGGFQLGTQGASPIEGGTLVVGPLATLGGNQLRFNTGTLEIAGTAERTFTNALSIGGRLGSSVAVPTISGADAVFTGTGVTGGTANGFFKNNGLSTAMAFNVNNKTTVTGDWFNNTGTAAGITLGGTGTFVITGNAAPVTETWTLTDSITFLVTSSLGGGVIVSDGTAFGGGGAILGAAGLELDLGSTLLFKFDGLSVDTISTAAFKLGDAGTGLIAVDFGGTAELGTYDLVTSASPLTGFTVGDVSLFEITNLGAGFTGTLSITADKLSITVSAIPEPSAFAALAGVMALGCAATRRRRASRG